MVNDFVGASVRLSTRFWRTAAKVRLTIS